MIVNINTYSDADFVGAFAYQQVGGAPIDLTGMALRMMVRRHAADATALIELSTANGLIEITDAPNGKFQITIPLSALSTLQAGDYEHSLIQTYSASTAPLTRDDIWRGALTHAIGPTRWQLGER
jgi:hypothetical protein